MVLAMAVSLLLLAEPVAPAVDWGRLRPVILTEVRTPTQEAAVREVHAAVNGSDVVLRFTLDRPVVQATHLPDNTPVSGRLRAILYVDSDDDVTTGLAGPLRDPLTGTDRRLELGVVTLGDDPDEGRRASALVVARLHGLDPNGHRHTLWQADETTAPARLVVRAGAVELRVPGDQLKLAPASRFVLVSGSRKWSGRLGER